MVSISSTMVFHFSDEQEMSAALRSFRKQLGPGRYTAQMFGSFLKAMARDVPIGVDSVRQLRTAVSLFGQSDAATAKLLEAAASDLARQPSVLGKLTFLAERAMPYAPATHLLLPAK